MNNGRSIEMVVVFIIKYETVVEGLYSMRKSGIRFESASTDYSFAFDLCNPHHYRTFC